MNLNHEPEVQAFAQESAAPFETLTARLDAYALSRPNQLAFVFLDERGEEMERLTFAQLADRSSRIARGLEPWRGQQALMLYSPGSTFICALLACFRVGVIAAPMPLPGRQKGGMARVAQVARNARAALVLTDDSALEVLRTGLASTVIHDLPCFSTETMTDNPPIQQVQAFEAEDVAYLQYTSGSTGEPKGVMITHRALMHNVEEIRLLFGHSDSTVMGNWAPTFHDMGLVGTTLHPIYMGIPSVQMTPATFIKRPALWLRAISKYRVTTSGGPNFAFDLCTQRISPNDLEGIDLSSWTRAFNGAEPVRPATLKAFAQRFGPYGFDVRDFCICYGLAESTLLVTAYTSEQGPNVLAVDPVMLESGVAQPVREGEGGRELVGCGAPVNLDVHIVDVETSRTLPPNSVGEIWVRGGSVGAGYWERPDLTVTTFQAHTSTGEGPFLRTGDLGFLYEGELFMTGRIKDLMIIGGRNIYPQDVEVTALQVQPALRAAAAFTVDTGVREEVVVVLEVGRTDEALPTGLTEAIRQAISREFGVSVAGLVFVTTANFARTTSGKVMRSEMRRLFLGRKLEALHEDVYDDLDQVRLARTDQPSPV
ncbi:AMP-binding protein [Deinococcus hopiensis]|uniref:Acyl-CoA synthetase (AMP-forming)/AMP-acid ligase II n=1 Tax=Deinococcus hopiensis KR-140 TaxID=695939 RepID=A0A1W1U9K1_9DEIO|nr:AMP-binding protein [Deinococcus hopiensis]SMB77768.1 Acyl-CoA synthetase (AMP-forming)/AMP-acid ligase II [Deinococcus hopiensis KR-140]